MRTQPDYPIVTAAIEIFADWWKQCNRKYDLESMVNPASNPSPATPATSSAASVRSGRR
jgi:hypothetical protein